MGCVWWSWGGRRGYSDRLIVSARHQVLVLASTYTDGWELDGLAVGRVDLLLLHHLRKPVINEMGCKRLYPGFEACFAPCAFGCWVYSPSLIHIFGANLKKEGSHVMAYAHNVPMLCCPYADPMLTLC